MAIENLTGKTEPYNTQNFTWYTNEMLYKMEQESKQIPMMELYRKYCTKYKRREACKLIGFPGSSPKFTLWLREHEFLSEDDCPHRFLIDENLMDLKTKNIYKNTQYDSCNRVISGSEYELENPVILTTLIRSKLTTLS